MLNRTIRFEPLALSQQRAQANRAPPVLGDEGHATEVERLDELLQVSDVVGQPQRAGLRLAEAAPQVIGGYAAVLAAKRLDQPPPVERPGGAAVDEEEGPLGVAGAFRRGSGAAGRRAAAGADSNG